MRGKEYSQVYFDGEPLGFVTTLGQHWKPWQIFRELYTNTIDEDGFLYCGEKYALGDPQNMTYIVVRCPELCVVYDQFGRYFVGKEEAPIWQDDRYAVYEPEPCGGLFNRGICVSNEGDAFRYRYNIKRDMDLSEDRLCLDVSWQVNRIHDYMLRHCDDPNAVVGVVLSDDLSTIEKSWPISPPAPSERAVEIYETAKRSPTSIPSRVEVVGKAVHSKVSFPTFELDDIQRVQFARACEWLAAVDMPVTSRVTFHETLGVAVGDVGPDNEIRIAKSAFDIGTKFLAGTLWEEQAHIDTGHGDMTRALQNHIIDRLMTLIEQIKGEPL